MSDFAVIVIVGLGTYLFRLSFIGMIGDRDLPAWATPPLRYVAPAVLGALIVPAVVAPAGGVDVWPATNPAFVAAVLAAGVAWWRQNVMLVILVGMGAIWLLTALL